ncbi:hypothetical protein Acid345_3408 [Candidatus Koribacter versatilis Ellin345]|uniref:Phage head morphogenesis domain-containing protein n=1 Tax=Koribacter versatilis (strain Ellin345) TaxID=204669 RepID=Q1IL41_KORVE|nr:hypothetical protein [Candidatus Koribacter versatilis]ABF42409.1 hypothetical protein Acid345_3408 [Candidatus Koribacter versatilis Ellin345]
MTPGQEFAAKLAELMRQVKAMEPMVQRQIVDLLQEARGRIIAQISTLDPERYTAAQLQALKQSIDRVLDEFRSKATQTVDTFEAKAAQMGVQIVDAPVSAAFGSMSLGQIDPSTLAIAQGYTADLIGALSKTAAANINAAIQRAFLGGQSLTDIIAQIGNALSGGKFDGLFGSFGARAESIAMNEILRVQSLATQGRMEDLLERHPDLQKQWLWIPAAKQPRILHQLASGQVTDVTEPYKVAGEDLMFPRDPNGSAWNTINCHCISRPYFAADALAPTAQHKGVLEDLGISVSVTRAA